jgi:hypothetical protein
MKVELHCHTSRFSACATAGPEDMLSAYAAAGYGAVYLTEHDAVWSPDDLATLQESFPTLRIFPGIERSLGDGSCHLLILGTSEPQYARMTDPQELLAAAADERCLTVLAHAYRWPGGDHILTIGCLPDAMELQTGNHGVKGPPLAAETAERLALPLVNAGDSHAASMVGRYWIETSRPLDDPRAIRDVVLLGDYRNCTR